MPFPKVTALAMLCVVVAGGVGCAAPRADLGKVSADLERRSGHSLTNTKPGEIVLPVSLDDGMSEDEAVTLALWNNAAFQETLADLGLSRADLAQAGMLPNPTLSMLIPVGAKPLELTAKYPVEALWLRPRRVAAAKLDLERTAQRLVQNGLDVIRDARVAFIDLAMANQRVQFAGESLDLSQKIAALSRARFNAGESGELEADTADLEALQAEEQVSRLRQDARIALERLRHLLGLGLEQQWQGRIAESPWPAFQARDVASLVTNALASRPDLRAAEIGLEAAGKRIGLAKAEAFTLAAGINAKEVGTDFLSGPALDLAVPIFNQNQGGTAQARAKFSKAARQYFTVRDHIVLEVGEARVRMEQARESCGAWREKILPAMEETARQAEQSYNAGNVSYLFTLESGRKLHDARLKAAVAAADFRRALAELERSVGRRLNSGSNDPAQNRR